jgi:competence protein ComEA
MPMRLATRFAAVVMLVSQVMSADESAREGAADAAAFQAVCGSCHATSLVEGLRTQPEWAEVVEQMVKIGARGTAKQFEAVNRVLLRTLTKVNVNTAGAAELASALELSQATADKIVERRTKAGLFTSIEQLKELPGVDPRKLDTRKDRLLF